jgi:hypothetical protein
MMLGTILSVMLGWILKQVISWMGMKLKEERLIMLGSAIDKVMTLAVMKVEDIIKTNGWDSIKSRNAVIENAAPLLREKFKETLHANGLNFDNPEDRRLIYDQMERMIPAVFKKASESPATPPVPPEQVAAPVVVVPAIEPEITRLNREELARHLG